MHKKIAPLYLVQFLLSLFQIFVLAHYLNANVWPGATSLCNALWIWAGFILPTTAGACMWNGDKKDTAWSKFFIQSGYQLLMFVIFALILSNWK